MSVLPQTIRPGVTNESLSTGTAAVICSGAQTEACSPTRFDAEVDAIAPSKAWERGMRCNQQL